MQLFSLSNKAMKDFFRLVKVEFTRIFSNNVLLAIFIGAPIFYGVLFGYVYQQGKVVNLPIVIVDQDNSPASDKIIDAFSDNEVLLVSDVRYTPGNILAEMPTKQYAAVITLPTHFEADIFQKRHPEIRVDLNMANIVNANTASKAIQSVLMTLNAGIEIEGLKKTGLHPTQATAAYESFKINFNKLYNSTGNYVTFMLPGILAAIMQQIIFLAMALVFSRDFEDDYFGSLIKESKLSLYHIAVKSTPFFLMIPIMWAIVSLFIPYFQIDADVFNFPMLILVTLLTLASMFIGMLFSIAIPSQLKATELLMVISTPAFILSGFSWPTLAFPSAISNVAQFIPLTQFLSAFRKIAFYGGDVSSIVPEIKMLLIIIIVSFIAMVLLLQLKINRYSKKLQENLNPEQI
jgi:ABC-2 type transport system permease protein